jgi:hypothetical protein
LARIDLDAARASRQGESHVVAFGGTEFTLAPEPPFEVAPKAVEGDIDGMLRAMLGDQYDAFMACKPSLIDVTTMLEQAFELYGFSDMGESLASVTSSQSISKPSRPTSPASTRSTLRTPVSAAR